LPPPGGPSGQPYPPLAPRNNYPSSSQCDSTLSSLNTTTSASSSQHFPHDPALYPPLLHAGPSSRQSLTNRSNNLPLLDEEEDLPPPHELLRRVWGPAAEARAEARAANRGQEPTSNAKGKGKRRDTSSVPAVKTAGSKRKAADISDEREVKKKRGGRAAGVANYSPEDVEALLDIVEEYLPIGGRAWNTVADEFGDWAVSEGRPVRSMKSLEAKYKQVRNSCISI
jgi:hypothetical protein